MEMSLRTKLLLSVGLVILLIMGTSTFLQIQSVKRNYLEAIEWRAEALAQGILNQIMNNQAYDSMYYVANQDLLSAFSLQCSQLYELNQAKHVAHISVINASHVIAAHNDKTFWERPIEDARLVAALEQHHVVTVLVGEIYHTLVPVIWEEETYIGSIDIGLPKHVVDEKTDQIFLDSAKLFAIFLFAAFCGLSVLVSLVVTKPIKHLITMGEKIAKGEFVHSILTVEHTRAKRGTKSSPDEIVALTAMFHDMLVYLKDMAHAATRISTGDLSQNVTPRSTDDVLGTAFQRMSAYLNEMATAATAISVGDIQYNIQPKTEQDVLGHAFNHLIAYIKRQVQVAEQIANGDVSVKVNILSDADVLGKSLNMMVENIRNIITELNALTQSALAGKLDKRGNAEKFGGEYGNIIKGINATMDAVVDPLHVAAEYMRRISKGDFPDLITTEYKGDFNEIKQSVNTLISTMDGLQKETDGLIQAVQNGNLNIRGNAEAFEGAWQVLVAGINSLIEAFVAPIAMTGMYIDRIAKGDIPEKITAEYQGDFNTIRKNLNLLIDATNEVTQFAEAIASGNLTVVIKQRSEQDRLMDALSMMIQKLHTILQEMDRLAQAVQKGKLETRGNAGVFQGGWQDLVVGMNNVINAFVEPINVTAEYLDRLSKGDIPKEITEEYKGDFNDIKQNLNRLIDATHDTTRIAEEIADGNLTVEARERSEQDRLMKALNGMIMRLKEFSHEMDDLVQAVQDGNLDRRGNTEAFAGGWHDLVGGVNNLIDAFVAPINVTAEFIDRIAKGDIPDKLTEAYKGDFNEIKQNLNLLIDAMQEITLLAEEIAAGNLTVEVQERSTQDNLMRALNMMIQRLSEVVSNVKMVANHVATSSEQMTSSAMNMSQGAAQQAAAMEEASSSMQQMAANIRQNADNARETEKIALQSAEYAEEGGKVVAETVMAMQQIAEKIAIIEDIATQTRMLSLNATIEAARAQEHGKAFSVVASEVRQLSDITKKAAEEINKLATSSLDVSQKAREMLSTLVPSIHKTAELVQEISAASSEQSTGTEQINTAIQQLDQVTQQNAATSDELASMAETLSNQATQLLETIAFFEVGRTAETAMQEAKKTREKRLPEAGPKVTRHEEPQKGAEDRESSDRKPACHGLEMIPDEAYGDEQDAEFERY